MKKRYIQEIIGIAVLLFAIIIDLMIVKIPWKTVPELPFLFEWVYGLTLAFVLNIPSIMGAVAVREHEEKMIDEKRFTCFAGIVLLVEGLAFSLNMAVGVYLQTDWITVFKHATPLLTSLLVFLVVYAMYDPIELRLEILNDQYDKLYAQICEKDREIKKIGNPCQNEKGEIAKEIDHYMEFTDWVNAKAREKKVEVRKCFMERLDDEDSIEKLSRSSQAIMERRTFLMDVEAEYHEFTKRNS